MFFQKKFKLGLNQEIPLHVWIRLFVLINLSTNKPGIYVNTAEKNAKNQQKARIWRRVLKSRRAEYLEN